MYRFIALHWNPDDGRAVTALAAIKARRRTSGRGWSTAYETADLVVWHDGARRGRMECHLLDGDRGVVLGQVFRRSRDAPRSETLQGFSEAEAAACVATDGGSLVENFWGRHAALLRRPASPSLTVMRDPSGAFPCFVTRFEGVEIFFSDLQDVCDLGLLRFSVNPQYLLANVMLPKFQKVMTGLNEVEEVVPGQAVAFTPRGIDKHFLWDPRTFAVDQVTDRHEAAALLRDTVRDTVAALAGGYDSILHNVGGLDSSIILSCLARTAVRPSIHCVTFSTASPGGDERYYARQASDRAGVPLIEAMMDPAKVDLEDMFHWRAQVSPMGVFDCTAVAGDLYGLAREKGAEALFYGVGGDNVFFQMPYILSALDHVREGGKGASLRQAAVEASRYGNKALLFTIRAMLKERFRPDPCFDYVYRLLAPTTRWPFVNPELLARGPQVATLHPMLIPDPGMAKGKYYHLLTSALMSLEYYDHWRRDGAIERIHPLLAQPVVEACLRIPTWLLVYDGVDRGLARWAFEDDLPAAVARRTSKSNPDRLYAEVFARNRPFIREVLLEGNLVNDGILMRNPLERLLSGEAMEQRMAPAIALEFLSWEIWTQKWAGRPAV